MAKARAKTKAEIEAKKREILERRDKLIKLLESAIDLTNEDSFIDLELDLYGDGNEYAGMLLHELSRHKELNKGVYIDSRLYKVERYLEVNDNGT